MLSGDHFKSQEEQPSRRENHRGVACVMSMSDLDVDKCWRLRLGDGGGEGAGWTLKRSLEVKHILAN